MGPYEAIFRFIRVKFHLNFVKVEGEGKRVREMQRKKDSIVYSQRWFRCWFLKGESFYVI